MTYTLTPPAEPIIPLDLLHMQLKLGLDAGEAHPEDPLILQYLAAAREFAQHYANRLIGVHTVDVEFDAFPSPLQLPMLPTTDVPVITYLGADMGRVTMDPSAFTVAGDLVAPVLAWPEGASGVTITFKTGDLPAAVIDGLLLLVAYRYRVRQEANEREMVRIWLGAQAMFDTVKVWYV